MRINFTEREFQGFGTGNLTLKRSDSRLYDDEAPVRVAVIGEEPLGVAWADGRTGGQAGGCWLEHHTGAVP